MADRMELEGTVIECSNSRFLVQVNENHIVSCTLSGKIRQAGVQVILYDRVKIDVSPYDTNSGRIIFRNK